MAIAGNILGTAVFALSLVCGVAAAGTAAPIGATVEIVRFNDLNLDQPRDVTRLLNRIKSAADRACGTRSFAVHYNRNADYEICYRETLASVVAHVNRPSVALYLQQHSSDGASLNLIAQQ
jgi:UrcA family protein